MTGRLIDSEALRRRYLADTIETATPAVRLGLLVDRLEADMSQADAAFAEGDIYGINEYLIHAQDILLVLRDTLDVDAWAAGAELKALYTFLSTELVAANMGKDRRRAAVAAGMIADVAEAWRKAIATSGPESQRQEVAGFFQRLAGCNHLIVNLHIFE